MKDFFAAAGKKISAAFVTLLGKPALFIAITAFLLNLIIEILSRHSVFTGFMFIFRNPVGFLLGTGIIALSFIPALLIKKRYPLMVLTAFLWVAMGITNCIITSYRLIPFSVMDFSLIKATIPLLPMYLGIIGLIGCSLAIIGAVVLVIIMFIKMPKDNIKFGSKLKSTAKIVSVFAVLIFTAFESGAVSVKIPSILDAYKSYGFTYCFCASIFSRGVTRPADYSQEAVGDIYTQLDENTTEKQPTARVTDPNIIFIQLESFFDPAYIKDIELSENPIPNFCRLRETCPHGKLTVPSIGGGTANTEFEVLTGMAHDHFGLGEYPYKTILQNSTCESICYNLKKSDYSAHAIHNHYATFYDRNLVYPNLGFDTFTSAEYMTYVPTTPLGWEKDEILPSYIDAAMKSTEGRDFVFTVTVQGHGAYPTTPETEYTKNITVTTDKYPEPERISMEYFANMLIDTDKMIADLTEMYKDSDEPVMIVFYGDHLPGFDMTDDDLTDNTMLQTEYIIWTNYALGTTEEKDLCAYQLSAYALSLCDNSNGILTKVHQSYSDSPDYENILQMIEYSMLYDDSEEIEEMRESYAPTDMKLGIYDIKIDNALMQYDEESGKTMSVVKGKNFTTWSVVSVNGIKKRTIFKNSTTLIVENTTFNEGDVISVSQITQDNEVLSVTDDFIVKEVKGK